MLRRTYVVLVFLLLSLPVAYVQAQPVAVRDAAEIQIALEKLNVLGSVLYIAAHPDDENTGALAYLSLGEKYRTAYLSLTRGDGGQNLIGAEKGVEIGMLRTQELLEARRIDGAEQFFSRAIDFGYSKTPEETYEFWGKEQILADIVWVIRKFQPDIIATRFPPGASGGHGNHTASAALAQEAFHAAADTARFPEQLSEVQPWQARRLYWNGFGSGQGTGITIRVNTGEYNPLLGESYTEISARSRSMHKTQGFGSSGQRGPRFENFMLVEGDPPADDLFDGIDTTWNRIPGGSPIGMMLDAVIDAFDPRDPAQSVPALLQIYDRMNGLEDNNWVEKKRAELLEVIRSCAGLWMEAISDDYAVSPGDVLNLRTTLVNRSGQQFTLEKIGVTIGAPDSTIGVVLSNYEPVTVQRTIRIPGGFPISQPYWLRNEPSTGAFAIPDQQLVGLAENPPAVSAVFTIRTQGPTLTYTIPILYRWTDRADGELYRKLEIRPPVTLNTDVKVAVFTSDKPQTVTVKVKAQSAGVSGQIRLRGPDGWRISPAAIPFSLTDKYGETAVEFHVSPPMNDGDGVSRAMLQAEATVAGAVYGRELVEITHSHIGTETYFPEARITVAKIPMAQPEGMIGYIMGAGDEIPACLRNIGYNVVELDDDMLENADLSQFDAIITGVRAYNTRERLPYAQPRLMEYVRNGGTMIVQYNVTSGLLTRDIGPYPFTLSSDRITNENAAITFTDPGNQLRHLPNEITGDDFEGWVQERGLYFANSWDDAYEPVLSGHDPDEQNLQGGELFARYGDGIFIYTGYAWFRQLPAGVPGAYRLFVNMISAGKYNGD